jgi:toxin ParE1/3/4
MPFKVFLVEDAERDIEDIYRYIAEHDSIENAGRVVDALDQLCAKLAELPERGNIPKELRGLGITEDREVHHDPYRVIYRVLERSGGDLRCTRRPPGHAEPLADTPAPLTAGYAIPRVCRSERQYCWRSLPAHSG